MVKPRHRAFLDALPKHKNKILPSAIEAGYSEKYAKANGRAILRSTARSLAQDVAKQAQNKDLSAKEAKQLMYEIIGMTREEALKNVKYLAEQEKDLSVRLKVMSPIVRELGLILSQDDEQSKVVVPVINLGFSQAENMAKNIEPSKDNKTIESQELDNGLTKP